MLNASGYVMTNTMAKAQNNAYYVSDSKGRIITKKLVKYKESFLEELLAWLPGCIQQDLLFRKHSRKSC